MVANANHENLMCLKSRHYLTCIKSQYYEKAKTRSSSKAISKARNIEYIPRCCIDRAQDILLIDKRIQLRIEKLIQLYLLKNCSN